MTNRAPTFNELLIQEVQNHPELYDQQHRVCTDSEERNCMWEEIARRIDENVTAGFAKKRWLQLRDRYRKELKTSLRNMTQPKWPYFTKLSWLDQYLKDSKSAGLNTLFLSNSFENIENASTPLDSFIKDKTHETSYAHAINANTLLENIMAVSSSAFEQLQRQREHGNFSPDSAIASNEDGDNQGIQLTNAFLNSAASTSSRSDYNAGSSSSSSDVDTKRRQDSLSPERRPSAQSDTSCETDTQRNDSPQQCLIEQTPLEQNIFGDGTTLGANDNFGFMGSVLRNLTAQKQQKMKQRNPPYLVRRGGGIKVKAESVERPDSLSAFKPLAKTMSVGGLISQMNTSARPNLQFSQSVGVENKTALDEWQTHEWSNDEDMLFVRLIVLRLRKLPSKDSRKIKSSIFDLLNEKEEQIGIN